MTVATLFSNFVTNEDVGGVPSPAAKLVNTGSPITHQDFTLTVSPSNGYAEATVWWGTDGVNFPGQFTIYNNPTAPASVTAAGRQPAAQYFSAELTKISPGTSASLTMSY